MARNQTAFDINPLPWRVGKEGLGKGHQIVDKDGGIVGHAENKLTAETICSIANKLAVTAKSEELIDKINSGEIKQPQEETPKLTQEGVQAEMARAMRQRLEESA